MTEPTFGFTVKIESDHGGEPAWKVSGYATQAEWVARGHTSVDVEFTLPPTTPGYTRDELLAIYRWYAGVLARIGLRLHGLVTMHYRYLDRSHREYHRCDEDPTGYGCGHFYDEGLDDPRACLTWHRATLTNGSVLEGYPQSPPMLTLMVPAKHIKGWIKIFERVIAETLAADLARLKPEPQPDHTPAPVLTEPATHPRKAST